MPSYVIDQENLSHLSLCLSKLEECTERDLYELIIIDNGSNYGIDLMKEKADIYIRKDTPMGYARAVNLGMAIANCDYLLILNNDLFVSPNWLPQMIADYESTVGGIMSPMDIESTTGIFYDQHWFSLILMSRKVFTDVGYLDEKINYRFHDQDYSIRVKKAGYEVMRTGNVRIDHINSATYGKMGRNEDPAERQIMIGRYGVAHFNDWIKLQ